MLFFIQFWRIPPSPARLCLPRQCLDGVARDRSKLVPVLATTKFFSLQVEPTGMLAPKVQATTIEVRVPLRLNRSQCRQEF